LGDMILDCAKEGLLEDALRGAFKGS
jgi:hypothetical protein